MEARTPPSPLLSLLLCLSVAATISFTHSDATSPRQVRSTKHPRVPQMKAMKHLGLYSNYYNYMDMGSPLSMPPYQYGMSPSSSPQEDQPYCVCSPLPPSTTFPTPTFPFTPPPPPPPPPTTTYPPILTPNPPTLTPNLPSPKTGPSEPPAHDPSPPTYEPSPSAPIYYPSPDPPTLTPDPPSPKTGPSGPPAHVPSPPTYEPSPSAPNYYPSPLPPIYGPPSPPEYAPSPPLFRPGPPVFLPPVVYPSPTGKSPPYSGTTPGMWCVAKPAVPDPIIQEAMNYACGSGADCNSIQPNGKCYQPDTLMAHASFAFNSYWQRTKVAGGMCDFGGTAIVITKDPSFDGCHFILS